jgi:hypothetical protein
MSREQAEKLIRQKEGKMCVRLYRRRDGTVLTSDCPVGVRAARRRMALWLGGIAAGVLAVLTWAGALLGMMAADRQPRRGHVPILSWFDPDPPTCVMGAPPPPPNVPQNPGGGGDPEPIPAPDAEPLQGGE